ncbi:MAG TPA: dihydroorotate dehydrogenase electron transfer subunit [Vicinamibacteria bacterium]
MPANRHAMLVAREPLDDAHIVLTFRHPEIANSARAGQFVMIKAGVSVEPPLRRPFSILSNNPHEDAFSLFIKTIGDGTRALARLSVGEVAQCLGPLGRPFTLPAPGTEAIMVAGGYGIAPFFLLSKELVAAGRTGRVFYGGRSARDLQLRERFSGLVALVSATEDGSAGQRGRVTAPLEAFLDEKTGPVKLYACGPDAMLHAVARVAEERGIEAEVSLDPWMGCGVGTCLGCVVFTQGPAEPRAKYRCACTEGPVFDSSLVVWPGDTESRARRRAEVEA